MMATNIEGVTEGIAALPVDLPDDEDPTAPRPPSERSEDSALAIDEDEEDDADSAYGLDDSLSDTTSVNSALYRGYIENGRKYHTIRDGQYWGPSDEQQFEAMETGHLLYFILDHFEDNQLFRSPIGENPHHIIDLGTGDATWAIEVADKYPSSTVLGVDLYPPPKNWVPPNCRLEVDDISKDWTWRNQFDLIHMRFLLGAFTPQKWEELYNRCYERLRPGGWIEQVELDFEIHTDDASLPPTSALSTFGATLSGCASRAGFPLDTQSTMRASIEAAGFTEIHEKLYKCPIGSWPKHKVYKDAGTVNREHWKSGLEGWALFWLTKFGAPRPWTADEVRFWVAKVRMDVCNPRAHIWHYTRRVWARKPVA